MLVGNHQAVETLIDITRCKWGIKWKKEVCVFCQRSVFVDVCLFDQMRADLVDFLFELVEVVVLCVYNPVPP